MKASDELPKKPRIDVRHMIDHNGLAAALGYAFKVDGNEDGDGGMGGPGDPSGGDPSATGPASADMDGYSPDDPSGLSVDEIPPLEELGVNAPAPAVTTQDPTDAADSADTSENAPGPEALGGPDEDEDGGPSEGSDTIESRIEAPGTQELSAALEMPALPFDFETRARNVRRRALGAGAQRSDNMADLLGYVPTRKARGQARAILGQR